MTDRAPSSRRRRRRRRQAARAAALASGSVVALTVAVVTVSNLSASRSPKRDTTKSTAPVPRVATSPTASNAVATDKFESFSVDTIGGGRFVSPAGKPAVVFFITSEGCGSCAADAAQLDATTSDYGNRIAVLGVEMVLGTPASALRGFRTAVGVHYPLAADPDGRLVERFGVDAVATTIVLDPSGRVVFRDVAPDTTALRDALAAAGAA